MRASLNNLGGSRLDNGGGSVVVNADGTISLVGNTDITGTFGVSGVSTLSGNVMMGTTIVNPVSGFTDQKGFGYKVSTGQTEFSSFNQVALQLGRYGSFGDLLIFRYAATILGKFTTTDGSTLDLELSGKLTLGTTVTLTEGSANVLELATGDSFNIVSGHLTVGGRIVATSSGPHAIGGVASGFARLNLRGSFTGDGSSGFNRAVGTLLDGQITGAVGDIGYLAGTTFANTLVTQDTDTNISVVAQAYFIEPAITNNLATSGKPDVAATVYIASVPSEGDINAGFYQVAGDIMNQAGMFTFKEISTPSAIADWGRIYTKTDDKLYFQDGAGVEHTFSVADYAAIRFDDNASAETIDLTDLYHLVTRFATNGLDEVSAADQANNRLTIGASRDYNVALCGSAQAAGGSKTFVFDVFEISQSTANITAITQATPGVVTATGHGFSNGDLCKITGVVGMTEINDKIYKVAGVSGADFNLQDDEGVSIATGGFGAWSSGGTVALATKTFAHSDRTFSNASGFGAFGSHWYYLATSGDAMEFYIKNKSDATDITFEHLNLTVKAL